MNAPTKAALIKEVAKWKKEANGNLKAGAEFATEVAQLRQNIHDLEGKRLKELEQVSKTYTGQVFAIRRQARSDARASHAEEVLAIKADAYDLVRSNKSKDKEIAELMDDLADREAQIEYFRSHPEETCYPKPLNN